MDPDSMSALNLTGTKEELDKVTNESLLKVYDELINNSYIDINVIGDIDEDHINELIKKYAKFNNKPDYELNYYITNKEKETPSVGSLSSSFRQTKLVYLYNTNNLTEYEKEYVLPIYNLILGGPTLETRLYKAVRDDQSLCYSIFSLTYAHDNLLRITTGIDLTKIDLTRSLIEKAVKDMNKVLPKEVEYAVSLYETMINMNLDSPSGLLDLYFTQYIFNKPDLKTRINTLKKITPQEIENLSNKIKLNTVFVLKGDKHE
jgi:predicted Zn-dependent peptidase